MSDQARTTSDRRVIPGLLLGLLLVFGAAYVAAYVYTADRIPRGTRVNGIDVGGLRAGAAERELGVGLESRAAEPLTVRADGEQATIRPATAGLAVDLAATVARTRSEPSWDPRRMWDWAVGRKDRAAVVSVDETRLDAAVAGFAAKVDDPAVQGAVRFSGGVAVPRYPMVGSVLDRRAAATALRRVFLHQADAGVVALPVRVVRSAVSTAAVSRAMDTFANPATSAPVTIRLGNKSLRLAPEDFTAALSMRPRGGELSPVLDRQVLLAAVGPKMRSLTRAARNATVTVVAGRPRITPARNGVSFDPDDVTRGFLTVLTSPGRTMSIRSIPARPGVTTADVRRLRITERVSAFTTRFPYAAYRNINLPRAAHLIDGTILRPGQTFSLNRTVGERTAANGFTKGYVISDGVFTTDFGGGVSQVATTTFNAAFFAGLADVEHKPHSFYISRYPVGREATVVWPNVDLKFTNTTPYGVLIAASVERATPSRKGAVTVAMYSTKFWDIATSTSGRYDPTPYRTRRLSGPGCVANRGYDGFAIDVYRLFHRHGSSRLDHRETMHTVYQPSDTVDCS